MTAERNSKEEHTVLKSGHGDVSLADMEPVFICQKCDELQQVIEIIHGFTASHDHNIGYPLTGMPDDG